jgi:hypothetical protein
MHVIEIGDKLTPDVMDQIELILANKPEPISDYR